MSNASGWAYLIVALLAYFDALVPVVPSETSVITAGVVASAGELNLPLKAAGNAYAHAADQATDFVWKERSVEGATAEIFRIYRDYFQQVTAERLLRELGYNVESSKFRIQGNLEPGTFFEPATAALAKIVPPVADEDGRIGSLRLGLPILRSDVHEVFYEMALRELLRE